MGSFLDIELFEKSSEFLWSQDITLHGCYFLVPTAMKFLRKLRSRRGSKRKGQFGLLLVYQMTDFWIMFLQLPVNSDIFLPFFMMMFICIFGIMLFYKHPPHIWFRNYTHYLVSNFFFERFTTASTFIHCFSFLLNVWKYGYHLFCRHFFFGTVFPIEKKDSF